MAMMVLGVFSHSDQAERALDELERKGYDPKDISLIMKEGVVNGSDLGSNVAGGTVSGATAGGVIGGLAGLLVGTGIFPGLGVLLIGGPISAALGLTGVAAAAVSGAATGALAGGVIGALTGIGVTEEDARMYEESIKEGKILVIVPAMAGEENQVRDILDNFGADQVNAVEHMESYQERAEYTPAYASEVRRRRRG